MFCDNLKYNFFGTIGKYCYICTVKVQKLEGSMKFFLEAFQGFESWRERTNLSYLPDYQYFVSLVLLCTLSCTL